MGHGEFSTDPETVWLTEEGTDDRKMSLVRDFSFQDPAAKVWLAPAGSVIDGARFLEPCGRSSDHRIRATTGGLQSFTMSRAIRREATRRSVGLPIGCSSMRVAQVGARSGSRRSCISGVRIGAAAPKVPAWHAAVAMETSGPPDQGGTADEATPRTGFAGHLPISRSRTGETDDPGKSRSVQMRRLPPWLG